MRTIGIVGYVEEQSRKAADGESLRRHGAENDFGFVFSACDSSISIDIGLHWEG
jgi:hypothetical protein